MNPSPTPPAIQTPPPIDMALIFGDMAFHHRWSKDGQHEFTPPGQEDLKRWTDLLTLNVHERVRNADQPAALANEVLGRYQARGHIARTDSLPPQRKPGSRASGRGRPPLPETLEAVFARFVLLEGRGCVVVRSHRFPGAPSKVADAASAWLGAKGPATEQTLLAWAIPAPNLLAKLPQAK